MDASQLGLESGTWVVANCGKMPSEKNCKLVIMAPEAQRDDLVEAAVAHAVTTHGHEDTPQLRNELESMVETVEM